jgi:hypothetical protein
MKTVVCINDSRLPEGAQVVKGREYNVVDEFVNNYDQRVFIIEGIANEGTTRMGLRWIGYDANRFADLDTIKEEIYEHAYAEA